MSNSNKLVSIVAKKFNKDVRVVNHIVNHPFKFLKTHVTSSEDIGGVRLPYFGIFFVKLKYKKEDRHRKEVSDILRLVTPEMLPFLKHYPSTIEELKTILNKALEDKDYDKIILLKRMIFGYLHNKKIKNN